ncbi:MAG: MurR/RpiR family transcriptional regulator [Clostridia bacterium]|nr:MurR/RpiR family transcriptional regulator [Clostridia bacterium]
MSNCIEAITQKYPVLTESEKKIATVLLKDAQARLLSAQALSARAAVSIATVSRFCKRLGYASYKELQLALASRTTESVLDISDADDFVESLAIAEAETVRLTAANLDKRLLDTIANLLFRAEKILFFGMGTAYAAGLDASLKFKRLQKIAFADNNTHDSAITLSLFGQTDVLIAISHSGETKETLKMLSLAKSRGIPTVALTTFPQSPIAKQADYVLFTATKEPPQRRISFTSRISQLFLLDALFLATLKKDKSTNLEKIELALHTLLRSEK